MNSSQSMYIAGCGVVTPAGNTLEMTHSSVESGISVLGDTPFFNQNNYPMKGAMVPPEVLLPLPDELALCSGRIRRMLQLALTAIQPLKPILDSFDEIPFLLAVPETLPIAEGIGTPVGAEFFKQFHQASEINLDTKHCRYIASGRPGGLELLNFAKQYFDKGIGDTVLIGAVDTYFDPATIYQLNSNNRVMAVNRKIGFYPSEAAIFLLITSDRSKSSLKASITTPGTDFEEGHLYSDKPCLGNALTAVCKKLLSNQDTPLITHLWSTANGEHFFMKEVGLAITRHISSFHEKFVHLHPADCYGDCGAASGLLLAALAAMKMGSTPQARNSLVLASSDLRNRAGVIVGQSQ